MGRRQRRDKSHRRLLSEHFRSDGRPKTPYDTREEAEAQAKRQLSSSHLCAYACGFCGAYHLGTRREVRYQ
jgi:hypothetical protein